MALTAFIDECLPQSGKDANHLTCSPTSSPAATDDITIEGESDGEAPAPKDEDEDGDHQEEVESESEDDYSEDEEGDVSVAKKGLTSRNKPADGVREEEDDDEERTSGGGVNRRKISLKRKSDTELGVGSSASKPTSDPKRKKVDLSSPSSSKKVGTTSSSSSNSNPVRSHALSQFETILIKIFSETNSLLMQEMSSNLTVSSSVSSSSLNLLEKSGASRSNEVEARRYAKELEKGLFDMYSEKSPKGELLPGKLYKDKFRTFLFGLKDAKNKALHFKIASGSLLPQNFVKMKGEELANDQIRDEIERKKKESLEMSIRNKELERENSNGMMVNGKKLNHKGEVDLDFEYRKEVETRGRELEEALKKKEESDPKSEGQAASSPSLGQGNEASGEFLSAPSQLVENDLPSAGLLSPSDNPFDFNHAWTEDDGPVVEEPSSDNVGMDIDYHQDHHEPDFSTQGGNDHEMKDGVGSEKGMFDDANDDLIDNFLGGNDEEDAKTEAVAGPSAPVSDSTSTSNPVKSEEKALEKSAEPIQRSTTPSGSPPPFPLFHKVVPLTSRPIFWSGSLTMPDVSTFSGNLHQVAGRPMNPDLPIFSTHFFTSPHLIIEGRIPAKAAADYLVQSRLSSRTELVVFAMRNVFNIEKLALAQTSEVSSGPDGVPFTRDANLKGFKNELEYFHGKDRYGVLVPPYEKRKEIKKVVKDFYAAPLKKDSPLPEWLSLLKPDLFYSKGDAKRKGKDKSSEREEDLILLVAVLWKDGLEAEIKDRSSGSPLVRQSSSKPSTPQTQANVSPTGRETSNSNSSVLQNLLKAVGGNGGSSNPVKGSDSPYQATSSSYIKESTSSQSPLIHAGSTASSLSQLPHSQLENVLSSNPSLVDQLLNSLKAGGGLGNLGVVSSAATPPGPPPRPPPSSFSPPPPPPPSSAAPPYNYAPPQSSYQSPYASSSPPRWNQTQSPPHTTSSWGAPPPNRNWNPPQQATATSASSPYHNNAPTYNYDQLQNSAPQSSNWGNNPYVPSPPPQGAGFSSLPGFSQPRAEPQNQMEGYSGSGWASRGRSGAARGGNRGGFNGPPREGGQSWNPLSTGGEFNNDWAGSDSNRPRKTGRSARRGR